VPGEGVWSYDETTGEISFDPIDGFSGDPTDIEYTIFDEDGNESTDPANINIEYAVTPPIANNNEDLDNALGTAVSMDVLADDLLSDGSTPSPSDVIFELVVPTGATLPVTGTNGNTIGFTTTEGTWLYNETTGVLEFTPNGTFEGDPLPITYNITDVDTGVTSTTPATVTITYEDRPVAVDDESLANTSGSTVTIDIVDNDTDGDNNLDPTTVSLTAPVGATNIVTSTDGDIIGFEVPGEGVWSYDETTGEISFDPIDGFTGDPTDIEYTIFDEDGNESTDPANINIEYAVTPPVAEDDINNIATDIGDPTVINVLTNDLLSDGTTPDVSDVTVDLDPSTLGVQTTLDVTGEGIWSYDPSTGDVTFTPEIGYEVSPTPIPYELVDTDTGQSDTATITVIYEIPPVADNESSTGNTPGEIVSQDILVGDTDADGNIDETSVNLVTPAGATNIITDLDGDVIGFTVPGEGAWLYDNNTGSLSFDPETGFTGDPLAIEYTVDDNDGNTSNIATVVVEYANIPPIANDDSSTGNNTGNPVTLNVLADDTLSDGSTPDPDDIIFDLVVPAGATDPILGTNGNTIGFTVPGEGVWIYDEATGDVTFTPEAGFTNDPTNIQYNLTDVDTGEITVSPATITIDYDIEFPITEDDEDLNNPTSSVVSVDILDNDNDPDGNLDPETVNLVTPLGATNIVTDADSDVIGFDVPGEGTWLYDALTEELTFTPESGFVEDPTPVSYTVDDNDGNMSNTSTVAIDYVDVADLSLTKIVVDNDITPLVGSEITFEVRVFNDGPQDASGVQVSDLLPSGYDFVLYSSTSGTYNETTGLWELGTVLSGESETLLIDVLVNGTGDYLNIAEVIASNVFDIDSVPNNDDGDQSEDDEDNAVVTPVEPVSDLSLVKTVVDGDVTPLVGSEITFQITVSNDGPQNATGVEITDLLPSGYDFVLFSSTSGAYNETTGLWNVGGIASGESETLLIDVLVNGAGDYINIAQVTASDILDTDSVPNNDDGDQSEDDEDNAFVTPVISIADLSLTKDVVDGDTMPLVGSEITFIITVTNDGPQDATGVEVTDLLPSGFDYILFSSTSGSYNETTGVWNVGNIANGATETLLIDVLVNGSGDYLNVAQISGSNVVDNDSAPNNDDGDQSEDDEDNVLITPLDAMADLSLEKTVVDNEIMPNVGDEITFQITVSNAGPNAATGVEVMDLLPQGFDFVRFSATSGIYDEITGLWNVGTVQNGSTQTLLIDVIIHEPSGTAGEYLNISQITASDVIDPSSTPNNDDGDQSEDDEDSILVLTETADLSLTKSVSNVNANVGDVITFTLQIDNGGANAATGVALEDILPIGYSNITNISNGGELIGNRITWSGLNVPLTGLTITYNGTVNMPTLQAGEYLNIAEITASDQFDPNSEPDNDDGDQSENDEDSTFINTPIADIEVTKVVDNGNPSIGETVVFTITASNLGSIDATSVEIIDVLPSGYEFTDYVASSGIYNEETGLWNVSLVAAGVAETLEITVKVLDVNDYVNTASLEFLDQIDSDESNDSADASIAPQCLKIYNEFSPNGNGKNEFFYIDCINNYPENKLEIYNRWGNVVYVKEGYDNTFDGISNGRAVVNRNEKLPVGTYYYVLDLGDGSEPRSGWLYLVR